MENLFNQAEVANNPQSEIAKQNGCKPRQGILLPTILVPT